MILHKTRFKTKAKSNTAEIFLNDILDACSMGENKNYINSASPHEQNGTLNKTVTVSTEVANNMGDS